MRYTAIGRSRFGVAVLAALSPLALGQGEIYSNGSPNVTDPGLFTGVQTASGVPAPSGFAWSEVQAAGGVANALAGFSSHLTGPTGAYRFADDFTVTSPYGWRIDAVSLFAYQPDHAGPGSPFAAVNLRIWHGLPDAVGSAVVFGDDATNRLVSSTPTNLYRVFTSVVAPLAGPPDTTRRIWESRVDAGGIILPPGTYWLDWQYTSVDPDGEAFAPAVTILAARGAAGWNAQQFKTTDGGQWVAALDTGKPPSAADVAQDFPFILHGVVFATPCTGDLNGDRQVNLSDLTTLLAHFGTPSGATLEDGDLNGDGDVDLSDLVMLLANFGSTCP